MPGLAHHRELQLRILEDLGKPLPRRAKVLDFGCGAGRLVAEYRRVGYEAFGCDIVLEEETPELRRVSRDPYRLPFQATASTPSFPIRFSST